MVLWWLGNIVLIFVVAPVCLLFLNRVLRPAKEIYTYADDILDHGVKLTGTLDSVPKLYQTRDLSAAARQSAPPRRAIRRSCRTCTGRPP